MMIDAQNLDIAIGKKQIVEDVSMHVQEGEFVGIIGPNGSGKSTTLKTIYRVLKQTKGAIYLTDKPLADMPLNESALKMSVVAQHNYYNFDFQVIDVVLMGRSPHKKPMERDNLEDIKIAEDALATVNMSEFRDRSFTSLSGGEQQRVVLARALAQQTPIIVLDEPTNHLDIRYQLQILDIVRNSGLTALCALHDLNLAAKYCDRLYLMKNGKLYKSGTPEEVLTEDIIYEVYGVKSRVTHDDYTGLLNIVYYGAEWENKNKNKN